MEFSIEDTVVNKATRAGWFTRKVKWVGRRTAPDRLFARNGRVLFVEFKDEGKDATVTQNRQIKIMRDAGIETHVINTVEDGLWLLGIEE